MPRGLVCNHALRPLPLSPADDDGCPGSGGAAVGEEDDDDEAEGEKSMLPGEVVAGAQETLLRLSSVDDAVAVPDAEDLVPGPGDPALPPPFSRHTKVSALLATLRGNPGRRGLLFCCPEEIVVYSRVAEAVLGIRTTTSVQEFKRDPGIALILMKHADAAGVNLAEASLLIRISISTDDPGQAIQQRGRLMRHTQSEDMLEVVIVSPGWEYMLLQLQRSNEGRLRRAEVQLQHLKRQTPRALCMTLFHKLHLGNRLGFRLDAPPPPEQSPMYAVHHVLRHLGLVLHTDDGQGGGSSAPGSASIKFFPPRSLSICQDDPFVEVKVNFEMGTVDGRGISRVVARAAKKCTCKKCLPKIDHPAFCPAVTREFRRLVLKR